MADIRSAQDVSLKDENTNNFMYGANQGTNISNTNLFASVGYSKYDTVMPTITDGNYSDLRCDNNGRLIVTSQAGGPALHIIIDDNKDTTVNASVHQDGYLEVKTIGIPLIYDNFKTGSFDTAKWNSAIVVGGTVTQTAGVVTLGVSTGATDSIVINSRNTFDFIAGSTNTMRATLRFDLPTQANNSRRWGVATTDLQNGHMFILLNGVLYARSINTGTPNDTSIDSYKPTDGNFHLYEIVYRDAVAWFFIDSVPVAKKQATTSDLIATSFLNAYFSNVNTGAASANNLILASYSIWDSGGIRTSSQSGIIKKTVELYYENSSIANYVANMWRRMLLYTVPQGYNAELIEFNSLSGAVAGAGRINKLLDMGDYNLGTQVFTKAGIYTPPDFCSQVEAEVTTATNATTPTLTITYINQDGVAGRTGTAVLTASAPIGYRFPFVLQAGDIGVREITACSRSVASTGVVKLYGITTLFYERHNVADQSYVRTTARESIVMNPGDLLSLEITGTNATNFRRMSRAILLLTQI